MSRMKKITPFIWFDKNAEEAANFYISLFPDSKITALTHYDKAGAEASKMPEGLVMTVSFSLSGTDFMALNGGPHFQLNGAVSFMIECDTQEEIDHFWYAFADGGKEIECGWVVDKFGMTWQVVPTILGRYMTDPDKEKAGRVMKAMLKMKKLEIEPLQRAYDGEEA
ncbi:VOC family protein [Candidatus Parcubacteria bacterium]|nr:VOC family protein [Candidatus Parcubacteria bacterium]